jgi:hypothetical protein
MCHELAWTRGPILSFREYSPWELRGPGGSSPGKRYLSYDIEPELQACSSPTSTGTVNADHRRHFNWDQSPAA